MNDAELPVRGRAYTEIMKRRKPIEKRGGYGAELKERESEDARGGKEKGFESKGPQVIILLRGCRDDVANQSVTQKEVRGWK